ncbi:HNH endonuclease [Cobetia amphilecti]|uniref:HNH endonuclease n=1 Tax=Cobetia amphilecti TaxID=1055104 RepID=A0ABT6USF5_9GAMM|nr:HNH endonuclease [Cobetia amphilecti]MDI5885641.1 HNH endonuclease [Cobetia amphilecti]
MTAAKDGCNFNKDQIAGLMKTMKQETKTEFVNRFMDVPFESIQGKYSFCNETDKKVLFSLDVGGNEDNDVILSSDWSRNGYAHSIKHIDKIINQGYDLFVFKVRTQYKNGKTIPVGFDKVVEKRNLVLDDDGVYRATPVDYTFFDDNIEIQIRNNANLTETEKYQLVMARRGQSRFRLAVAKIEPRCRITGLADMQHLKASHIKPWRVATNSERLDGHNGLMLTPHIDHLFDQGYISFTDEGKVLLSSRLGQEAAQVFGIYNGLSTGSFTDNQKVYLAYHRDNILKAV